MPEDANNNSTIRNLAGTLKPEAEKHPMFRTQSERDNLDNIFDKITLPDIKDINNVSKQRLQG